MRTFYDDWLDAHRDIAKELDATKFVARDKDIPWVGTPQDVKCKLMVANDLGYATMGSNVLKAEIPVGWHTGKHSHGEESMHILSGTGFSIIGEQRFDWHKSSTVQIPYGMPHQHFNAGDTPVLYISAMAFDLERFVRLARLEQLETCGPNNDAMMAELPAADGQYYADGSRAAIHIEDAPADDDSYESLGNIAAVKKQHDFIQYLVQPKNGFRANEVAITHQWIEPPYHHSGRHKHLEAVVYAVEGQGYTDMQGQRVPWEAGDVLYVPPAMWEHEHTNDNPNPIKQLRIAFGIRQWFVDLNPAFQSRRIYDRSGRPIEAGPIERHRERTL
jgi:mannose-6-phosphate isomerase-like protein (cupin superfamily)